MTFCRKKTYQGSARLEPTEQKLAGRMGFGNLYFLWAAQVSWAHPVWGWAVWMTAAVTLNLGTEQSAEPVLNPHHSTAALRGENYYAIAQMRK